MPLPSAGILLYRIRGARLEVLLAHPGGPFWQRRDEGAWTIPKGELDAGEEPESTARREFLEELGAEAQGVLEPLGTIRQRGGKLVHAFALMSDFDVDALRSNPFEMEWPPRSGRMQSFPEVDRAAWFDAERARSMILESQRPLIDRLEAMLAARGS